MFRWQSVLYVLKVFLYRSLHPEPWARHIIGIVCFCIGCSVLFAFMILLSARNIFVWLTYGALGIGIIIGAIGIICRIIDIIKGMRNK